MLRRAAVLALRALLELAQQPTRWLSVSEIANAQELPAPMLEQLLLQLRRAGLVEARRGRHGGYRLARPATAIAVAEVLQAVGANLDLSAGLAEDPAVAEARVLLSMGRRLQAALERELATFSLEELLFDLSSCKERLNNDGGVMLG
jgi:Rrf2 family transcriptional regulator, iron-sulfur cluster assembly transcription factor